MTTIADLSEWPIVKVTFPKPADVRFVDALYDELEALLPRGRHIEWTDLRPIDALWLPATVRKRAAERERRLIDKAERLVIADVRIVANPLRRAPLTLREWLLGATPWPVATVSGPDQAYAWLRSLSALRAGRAAHL